MPNKMILICLCLSDWGKSSSWFKVVLIRLKIPNTKCKFGELTELANQYDLSVWSVQGLAKRILAIFNEEFETYYWSDY
jgi:hypothetical protein